MLILTIRKTYVLKIYKFKDLNTKKIKLKDQLTVSNNHKTIYNILLLFEELRGRE